MRVLSPLMLAPLLVAGLWPMALAAPAPALLETGEFHGDEVQARTGETWLGLVPSKAGGELRAFRLKVEATTDSVLDAPGQKSARRISVPGELPLFLVKGVPALKAGPASALIPEPLGLYPPREIRLGTGAEALSLRMEVRKRWGDYLADARLELRQGDRRQVLYDLQGHGEATPESWKLRWAGDLDRDGKPDLYLQLSDHYNRTEQRLYLSSGSAVGEIRHLMARFVTTGC